MNIRNMSDEAFPEAMNSKDKIGDLARVFWTDDRMGELTFVRGWKDVLNIDVLSIGNKGLGPLFSFMDGDMALAYLPAWIILSYELPFPSGGFLPALAGVLDNGRKGVKEQRDRFQFIDSKLNGKQRDFVSFALNAIAERHLANDQKSCEHLKRIARYWHGDLKPM